MICVYRMIEWSRKCLQVTRVHVYCNYTFSITMIIIEFVLSKSVKERECVCDWCLVQDEKGENYF